MLAPLWVFAYGSLIFRPGFSFVEARNAFLEGYGRKFWQGSTDHRGVPGAPGRVVTLVSDASARCWGRAFRVAAADADAVLAALDHRERGGYERRAVCVYFDESTRESEHAVVYLAGPENPNYLGEASLDALVQQIQRAHGPSGSNREYVLGLARGLRECGLFDAHVFEVEAALLAVPLLEQSGV